MNVFFGANLDHRGEFCDWLTRPYAEFDTAATHALADPSTDTLLDRVLLTRLPPRNILARFISQTSPSVLPGS